MTLHTSQAGGTLAGLLPSSVLPPYRQALASHIERMIEMLDALDGDPDLEPDDADLEADGSDEPSLGSTDRTMNQDHWGRFADWESPGGDLELDDCDLEDGGDTEANGDEMDYSDHPSGHDGGIGDLAGLAEQTTGFDAMAYEDEPAFGFRPCSLEQWDEKRRAKRELIAQAGALRRVGGLPPGLPPIEAGRVRPVMITGADGHLWAAEVLS